MILEKKVHRLPRDYLLNRLGKITRYVDGSFRCGFRCQKKRSKFMGLGSQNFTEICGVNFVCWSCKIMTSELKEKQMYLRALRMDFSK